MQRFAKSSIEFRTLIESRAMLCKSEIGSRSRSCIEGLASKPPCF